MSNHSEKQAKPTVTYGTPTIDDWKLYLRNLQQVPTQRSVATPESSSSESSFELEESFKALLQRKRQEMQDKKREEKMPVPDDKAGGQWSRATDPLPGGNDSTFLEQDSISKVSDTSFEEMERICAVLDKVNGFDTSIAVQVSELKPVGKLTLPASTATTGDVTQLEDVDEPSGLWENTMLHAEGVAMLSPVKRMHMLRPSTILEESSVTELAARSKDSSIDTFASAKQTESTGFESSTTAISGSEEVYRTAQETFETDSYARSSMLNMDSGLTSDITSASRQDSSVDHGHESGYSKNTTREAGALEDEQDVIVLDSESDSEDELITHGVGNEVKDDTYPLDSLLDESNPSLLEHEPASIVTDVHDESTAHCFTEVSVMDEMPDRFNDTLEETDFMLKQGMKLLAMKKQQEDQERRRNEEQQTSKTESDEASRPLLLTPSDVDGKKGTATGTHISYFTPTNANVRSKLNVSHGAHSGGGGGGGFKQALFTSANKNPPSAGSFKKPSRLAHLKVPGRKFDHIVSPIGAYIKKTPQSMLQTKINCHNKNLIDVLHNENRDSVMSSGSSKENHANNGAVSLKGYTSSLPGKGVISSHRAHVLDERNKVRIPGGEKMHKLINNSPTMVIRHEGRIRYADKGHDQHKLAHNTTALGDDSLADLSVLSSDVSVRVLKDAKRYN